MSARPLALPLPLATALQDEGIAAQDFMLDFEAAEAVHGDFSPHQDRCAHMGAAAAALPRMTARRNGGHCDVDFWLTRHVRLHCRSARLTIDLHGSVLPLTLTGAMRGRLLRDIVGHDMLRHVPDVIGRVEDRPDSTRIST